MLDVKVNGDRCQLEARGFTDEIMADICLIINGVYATMLKQNKELAHIFRKGLTRVVCDPDTVLWDPSGTRGTGLLIATPIKREGEDNG